MGSLKIRYCQKCGNRIAPEDFDRGAAITPDNLSYCSNCRPTIPQEKLNDTYAKKRGAAPSPQTKVARHFRQQERDGQQIAQSKNARLIWGSGAMAVIIIVVVGFAIRPQSRHKSPEPVRSSEDSRLRAPETQTELSKEEDREQLKEGREQVDRTKFDAIRRRSDLACANGDFVMAINCWDNIPEELKGSAWEKDIEKERNKILEAKRRADARAEEMFHSRVDNANRLVQQGKYDEAILVWKDIPVPLQGAAWSDRIGQEKSKIDREQRKSQAVKYDMEGREREKANHLATAVSCYTNAIDSCPEFYLPYLDRARARVKQKDLQGALDDYTVGIKHMPPNAAELYLAYYNRGLILDSQLRGREAVEDFCKVLDLAPNWERAPQICQYLREALKKDPDTPSAPKIREYLQKYGVK